MESRFATSTPPDRPEFAILIDGTELEAEVVRDVLEIDVDERVNGHAIAQILMRNWDPETRTPLHSSGDVFVPGAKLTLNAGYRSELSEVFSGPITALTVNFPPESMGVVTVEARSESSLMATRSRARSFEEQNLEDRFVAIAQEYGLEATVGDSDVIESLYDDKSDWDRVIAVAEQLGWVGYVRDATLHLGLPAEPDEPVELTYGRNILELQLTEDLRLRSDPIVAAVWDSGALEPVESEADAAGVGFDVSPRDNLSDALAASGFAMRQARVSNQTSGTQADAEALASGLARNEQLAQIAGTGMVIGIPALRCDQWLRITGSGKRTDGLHYVSRIRHRIGRSGYTTEFTLGLPEKLEPSRGTCCSPNMLLGVVINTEDPAEAGRVQVDVAASAPEVGEVWARLASLDAGPEHGSVFIPAVGNEVVVGFAGQDPIVLGQLYSTKHPPPLDIDTAANNIRGFQSPGGHKIILDDSDDAAIEVTTAGGNTLRLSDGDKSITISEPSGNMVVIDGDGLALTAASGDIVLSASTGTVKIDASAIEAKASGPSKFESSATLDIAASATLGLSGALININ